MNAPIRRPQILAPAGDMDSFRAALAVGADAVYLGLDEGFNARARARNFSLNNLADLSRMARRAGVRLYLTLNTLLFESEIPIIENIVRQVAAAGVDAIIVQDPAVALLARAICPGLSVHASTQMTISSPEAARFAKTLGVSRIVLPRELSVTQIDDFAKDCDIELETFMHGALCVSWSGQCLSSEVWGGRSANRGQCAQACRMPYELNVDGQAKPTDELSYLLSPKDLTGVRALPALMQSGVRSFKIEGRLKGPAYVISAVAGLRRWMEAVAQGKVDDPQARANLEQDLAHMSLTYSRGLSDGWLAGADHQSLVEGRFPKHRGMYLGRVLQVRGNEVLVQEQERGLPQGQGGVDDPLPALGGSTADGAGPALAKVIPKAGMGVVFDQGEPEDKYEPGGPIFAVEQANTGFLLRFGRPGPDLQRVQEGDRVWITSDPSIQRQSEGLLAAGEPEGRIPISLTVRGRADQNLEVQAIAKSHAGSWQTEANSTRALVAAKGGGIDRDLLIKKLGAFGGTIFNLDRLNTDALRPGLHLPVSELKSIRRQLVAALCEQIDRGPTRDVASGEIAPGLLEQARAQYKDLGNSPAIAYLVPLCRTDEQLDAVIEASQNSAIANPITEVELDWMEMVGLGKAAKRARAAGLKVTIATVRVQKPGELGYDKRIERLDPEAVLVRHWGGLMFFSELPADKKPVIHGDFSLNVTNSLSAHHLLNLGLHTLTAAHDLDAKQLFALLDQVPAKRVAVTIHHHIPTFHTEYCVYARTLSKGRDWRSCGRPCEEHRVALKDHRGLEHPVIVDVGCRNTVFNAQAQSAAHLVPELMERGVQRMRLEFVWENHQETSRVLRAYQGLLAGESTAKEVLRSIGVHEQFGVTRGTMRVLQS